MGFIVDCAKGIGNAFFDATPEKALFSGVSILFLGYQDSNLEIT